MTTSSTQIGAGSASPPTAGSASDLIETWNLVRDLRNALAAAGRVLVVESHVTQFLAEAREAGVDDGIGVRAETWLKSHSPNASRQVSTRSGNNLQAEVRP